MKRFSAFLALATLLALGTPAHAADTSSVQLAQAADGGAGTVAPVNRFNRLMKAPAVDANAPPTMDGIHDPANTGTEALQPPKEAFGDLPKGMSGNKIDWVKALRTGAITPRSDKADDNAKKQVMDLDIIREVKGSMPDVVYPHKGHTEWLDCAQCHPKIFVPKKGGNPISMAAILMGQYCGVCHGKVAFPVSECSRCHSKPKSPQQLAATQAAATAAPVAAAPAATAGTLSKDDLMKKGKQVYADNCSGCHGANGEGTPGTFPALKGSKVARGPVDGHIKTVLKGVKDTAMQAWADSLNDEEAAAVITYERNAWGNNTGDVVQPGAVKALR